MPETRYDTIGKEYNATRKADPYLTGKLYELLLAVPGNHYLDIGCGTGNYLNALSKQGLNFTGVDPSLTMLEQAEWKNPEAHFICAKAENIPLPDQIFDGAIAIFTIHHWDDMLRGLKEVRRVLKPGSRFVCFSFTPRQMKGYWLNHYFPLMMQRSWEIVPEREEMAEIILQAGFSSVFTENYTVHEGLEDHFLYSSKHHPERYLDAAIRKNASSFSVFAEEGEVERGLSLLEGDIRSGYIETVMEEYANELGDYIFYIATV